jgi:hypothetical protein
VLTRTVKSRPVLKISRESVSAVDIETCAIYNDLTVVARCHA